MAKTRNAFREKRPPAPTTIDLFAGAGGASRGLRDAGFQVLAAIEVNPDAAASYSLNHPRVRLFADDIRNVVPKELGKQLMLERGQLTLLKACPPCQGFSTLGSRDPDDPRNDLTLQIWPFVQEFFPSAFIVENVPGIDLDERLMLLVRQSRAIGYHVRRFNVDAVEFGVPQRRRRHIVIGVASSQVRFPAHISELLPRSFREPASTAGAVLRGLDQTLERQDPLNRARVNRLATLERIRAVPIGGTRFDLPDEHQLACHRKLTRKAATGAYGRVRLDRPAPTMTTRCTTPACGPFIHPTEDRGLTLREAATLQTFPTSYRFVGGYDSIERQIGNAVPVRMAAALGHVVRRLLKETTR